MTRAWVLRLAVNGRPAETEAWPGDTLLDVLRDGLGLGGTRPGCRQGACGACHVLLEGRSVASCEVPAESLQGVRVTTLEGLDPRIADAFVAEGAAQCGYCIPGVMVSTQALLAIAPRPTAAQIRAAMARHLCRCGVHARIERAVRRAAAACDGDGDGDGDSGAVGGTA